MTTITKERIELFIKNPLENGLTRGEQMELARIALASMDAEPVAWECGENIILFNPDTVKAYAKRAEISPKPLYAAPPAPVVPDEWTIQDAVKFCRETGRQDAGSAMEAWNACRGAMLQDSQPVSQTYNLPELIEGMEVSIDVSTCDADAGNRYFGTVTEVSELYTAKNGYILLVQDAEPNFDVNGNSPVIPDGYVLVPVEPTPEMREAFHIANEEYKSGTYDGWSPDHQWQAMLAAAPQQEASN